MPSSTERQPRSRLRTHQTSRSRSGTGLTLGANEKACVSPALPALEVDRDEHGDEEQEVDEAGAGRGS